MAVEPGKMLSHYRLVEKIGEGGMGVVWKAEDTVLGRKVAIKVLPDDFAHDADRLARFRQEARLLASLNHPNIAAIHGFEESDGVRYLVLELVPGQTLAERIARGPLPVDEALTVCKQIAEALEAAHETGIIHRDLKPANIKITPDGKVKVLDFGLAKAFEAGHTSGPTDASLPPTLTTAGTMAGVILGTAAYMSPEQARGKPLDKRTDIWSFGCVLYEALTGKVAFLGETVSDTIAKILEREPDWQSLPENTPAILRSLMRHCLKKDPNQRVHDVSDARILIEEALAEPSESLQTVGVAGGGRERRARAFIIMALVTIVAVAIALWSFMRSNPPAPPFPTRLVVDLLPNQRLLETVGSLAIALSPDDTRLLYIAESGGRSQLYLRSIDQFEASPIAGTEGAQSPFFSADGQWVGFYANGRLQKVSVTGGAPLDICDTLPVSYGASWGPDGTIIFAVGEPPRLMRVSATGGMPQALPAPELGRPARWPQVLPDGSGVLSTLVTDDGFRTAVLSLQTGEWRILDRLEQARQAQYIPTGPNGYLVYAQAGGLTAVPFDLARLEPSGAPVSILGGVHRSRDRLHFMVSHGGSLVYVPGSAEGAVVWVDREGRATPLPMDEGDYRHPRVSPDGGRVASGWIQGGKQDIWVYDIARGPRTRLTVEGNNLHSIWSPDGKQVAFNKGQGLYWKAADGSGEAELLWTSENVVGPMSWSPDGLLAFEDRPPSGIDVWVLNVDKRSATPFLDAPHNEVSPMFSPDGRWLAYVSDESGRREVYVQPYPGPGQKWTISTDGGTEPVWSANVRELFYRNGQQMLAVAIQTEPTFSAEKPRLLFDGQYQSDGVGHPNYDVSPDGQRFLMVRLGTEPPMQINVVLNWFEELKRRVPTGSR